jgi:hypothetical protein
VLKNRVPQEIEDAIVTLAIEQPRCQRAEAARLAVSPSAWLRRDLETMASGSGTSLWHNWVGLAALNLAEWSGETRPGGCSVGTRAGAPRRGRMEEACARWQGTQICEKTSAVGQPCSTVSAIGGTVAGLARPGRAVKPQCRIAAR